MTQSVAKVLVVDDSAVVRGLLVQTLEADPYITVAGTAMHGLAALEWLRKNHADVVVLDVEMPVMDGLTALRAILAGISRHAGNHGQFHDLSRRRNDD